MSFKKLKITQYLYLYYIKIYIKNIGIGFQLIFIFIRKT